MQLIDSESAPATSRWSSRVALFALGLVATAFFCHRLLAMTTPVAANLFAVALLAAVLSLALAGAAWIKIWRRGLPGSARIVFGVGLSCAILLIPLMVYAIAAPYPVVPDVTTDPASPPQFDVLAKERPPGSNSPAYRGDAFAARQARAYPDIRPILIPRSRDEAFDLAVDAVKRMKMLIVRQNPPDSRAGDAGQIEAVDRTLVMGFYDDVAVRVSGDDASARIDLRSASRFGRWDLGRNAERLRLLTHEIEMRLAATQPIPGEERVRDKPKPGLKSQKGADQKPAPRRRSQDPDR